MQNIACSSHRLKLQQLAALLPELLNTNKRRMFITIIAERLLWVAAILLFWSYVAPAWLLWSVALWCLLLQPYLRAKRLQYIDSLKDHEERVIITALVEYPFMYTKGMELGT